MTIFLCLFAAFGTLFLSVVIAHLVKITKLRNRARERWRKTRGKVLEFGLSGNWPEVVYEYNVDGKTYRGYRMTLDQPAQGGAHQYVAKKSIYEDGYGRLLYAPGRTVEVIYDPEAPEQSTLTLEKSGSIVMIIIIFAAFFGGVLAAILYKDQLVSSGKMHKELIGGSVMTLVGIICLFLVLKFILKYLRSRDFSSVEGNVLEASCQTMTSSKGNSYTLGVKYEYEVQNTRYFSRQVYAMGITVGGSNREAIEKRAAELLADPKVRIYYYPRTPWRCYLRQGPFWMIPFMLIFVAVFGGLGIKLLLDAL